MCNETTHGIQSMLGLLHCAWKPIYARFTPLHIESHLSVVHSTAYGMDSIRGLLHCP